jgi:hypothetical protein
MATRARIGIQLSDGSVLSAYHHWDGYPEWLGRILRTHYNSKELASELIDGGDMSSCWTKDRWDDSANDSYGPQYYSQRGEDCPPRMDSTRYEYISKSEEYSYLFLDDEWICWNLNQYGENKNPQFVDIPAGDPTV